MHLERVAFEVRPRTAWEAVDLGMALVRAHARPVWTAWFAVATPWFALCCLAGWWLDHVWLTWLFLWWSKPLLDRVVLHVLSRAVFGATPTLGQTLREVLPAVLRALPVGLTVERLDLARSFDLPVSLLEGQTWGARRARTKVLQAQARSTAVWVTVLCAHFETFIYFGLVTVGLLFVPFEYLPETAKAVWATLLDADSFALGLVKATLWFLAICLIEPFYVGAGFGLYLNRRTQLESWDLELTFRRLAARLGATAAALVCAVALAGASLHAPAVGAAEPEPAAAVEAVEAAEFDPEWLDPVVLDAPPDSPAEEAALRDAIDGVLAEDPNLVMQSGNGHWQLRNTPQAPQAKRELPAWLESLLRFFLQVFELLAHHAMWFAFGLLVVIAWVTRKDWLPLLEPLRATPPVAAKVVRAGAEDREMPGDPLAAARAAWAAGDARRAIGLLYRDAVRRLALRLPGGLPRGATEAQCLRAARALQDLDRQRFARLVAAWQAVAWAHRAPSGDEFEVLMREAAR